MASLKASRPSASALVALQIESQDATQDIYPGVLAVKGATLTLRYRTLRQLIASAYKVHTREVIGPGWISQGRFDLEAKLPPGTNFRNANEMLQALLEARFSLRVHREERSTPGFALIAGRDGAHLTPSTSDPAIDPTAIQARVEKRLEMMSRPPLSRPPWQGRNLLAKQLAHGIETLIHAPVVDETNLPGRYDVTLDFSPDESPDATIESQVGEALARVGLKLIRRKIPLEYVIVDSVAKTPVGN